MTNTSAQDFKDAENANVGQAVYFYTDTSGVHFIGIEDEQNDNGDSYSGASLSTNYYLEIQRSGTTLTCKIYSDATFTTLVDTLSIVCNSTSWRYLSAFAGENSGFAGTVQTSGYFENLILVS